MQMSDVIGQFKKRGSNEVLVVTQLQRSEGFDLTSKFTYNLQREITIFCYCLVWRYLENRNVASVHKFHLRFDDGLRKYQGLIMMNGCFSEFKRTEMILKECLFGIHGSPDKEELICEIAEYKKT